MSLALNQDKLINRYENDGYVIIPEFITDQDYSELVDYVKSEINNLAKDCDVSYKNYLYATGRWSDRANLTANIAAIINRNIQQKLYDIFDKNFVFSKSNVILKDGSNSDPVPFHQDISYAQDNPYSLSVWIALTKVTKESGPLTLFPSSHLMPIRPAIDFWSPFHDSSIKFSNNPQSILLNPGDAVIFNARLWHGSPPNYDGTERMAYVSRWKDLDEKTEDIIPPVPEFLGMWNCKKIAIKRLNIINKMFYDESTTDLNKLLDNNIEILTNKTSIPSKLTNTDGALNSLANLKILEYAANNHYAGDLGGKIYKSLWFNYLRYWL